MIASRARSLTLRWATLTANSSKANSGFLSTVIRPSGISTTTAASATALVRSLLKARKFATNICKTWCRSSRATTTPRRISPNSTAAWRQPAGSAPSLWRRSLKSPARLKFCLCRAWSPRVKRIPWKPVSATQPTSGRGSKERGKSRG